MSSAVVGGGSAQRSANGSSDQRTYCQVGSISVFQTDLAHQLSPKYRLGRNEKLAGAVQLAMADQRVFGRILKDAAIMPEEASVFYGNRRAGYELLHKAPISILRAGAGGAQNEQQ